MNSWFRLYSEFAHDPKVQALSESYQRRLVMIFCLRSEGALPKLTDEEIAFALRITAQELAATKAVFVVKGFIGDDWSVTAWDKRQYNVEYQQQERHRQKRAALGLPRRRWINPSVRAEVLARDGKACVYCSSEENLTLDHIIAESRGGLSCPGNLVSACRACNAKKRDFTIEQAQMQYRQGYAPPSNGQARPSKVLASTDSDTDSDTEQKQTKKVSALKAPLVGAKLKLEFETNFWPYCWLKVGRGDAEKAYIKQRRAGHSSELICDAATAQGPALIEAASLRGSSVLHPATWLNQGRFRDEGWADDVPKLHVNGKSPPGTAKERELAKLKERLEIA